MPKISVLMPVYKTPEPFLREAVESILNQTAENFEFLILDDCPEDRAAEAVIASYDDARIKYFRNERNLGIAGSRNRLMEMATGDYLAVADHDDVSLPQRLEKEAAYLDAHRECGVVSGWYQLLCRKRGRIRRRPEHNAEIGAALAEGCAVIHPACMLRRQELERLGVRYEEAYTRRKIMRCLCACAAGRDFTTCRKFCCCIGIFPKIRRTGGVGKCMRPTNGLRRRYARRNGAAAK